MKFKEWKENYCFYPSYGVAPHTHDLSKTGSFIGSTILINKKNWPDNFSEDPEVPGLGVYNCPFGEKCLIGGVCPDYEYFLKE